MQWLALLIPGLGGFSLCMFFLRLCCFSLGTPGSTHNLKNLRVRLIVNPLLPLGVDVYVCLPIDTPPSPEMQDAQLQKMDGTFVTLTINVCRGIALRDHPLYAHAQTQTDIRGLPSNQLELYGFPTY